MAFQPISPTPTLIEVINAAIDRGANELRVSLPGKIDSYDPATQKASVKPLIKRLTACEDGTQLVEELPIINDVPVIFPRSGQFFLSFPLMKGDCVLLLFADWNLDNYLTGRIPGEDVNPDDFRNHDLSDAVCLPGFYPFMSSLKQADPTDMTLGKDAGGIQIHLTPGGTVDVKFGGGTAALSAAIAEHLESLYSTALTGIKDIFANHIHPTGVGPSGPPTTSFPVWTGNIASTKLKLES